MSSSLIDEREEEVMVSKKGYILKKTHFLKPSIDVSELPLLPQRVSVSPSKLNRLSSRLSFSGFWFSDRHFLSWLGKMEALYEPVWRKAGIFEAIKASTYNICKNHSLILSLAQKWCPETKSFLFPFGEATITLEDVMVLLGFSVLGSPVFVPLESSEMKDSVNRLHKEKIQCNSKDNRVSQIRWISNFLGRGGEIEHEAFLALWLSHFVFPASSRPTIYLNVLPIAIRLARGERIALAPAVLAFIYRDLDRISGFIEEKCDENVIVKSLFKLVQVWTWERFRDTRPKALVREIPKGEPRISRWDSLAQSKNSGLSFEDFDWRPYTKPLKNWNPLRFYVDEAMCVTVDENLGDDEFTSFAKCVRVSHLVGNGFVESYYPNRVGRQLGFDQDLPGLVNHYSNFTENEAWDDYNKSLDGLKLYLPSCQARGSVTKRYQDWWLKSVSSLEAETSEDLDARKIVDHYDDDDDDVSPKVVPLSQVVQKLEEGFLTKRKRLRTRAKKKIGELTSGWRMITRSNYKRARVDNNDDDDSFMYEDDEMTIAQKIRLRKKDSDAEKVRGDGSETLGMRRRRYKVVESDESDDSRPCEKLASVKREQICEIASASQEKMQICDDGTKKSESLVNEDGEEQRYKKEEEEIDERLKQRKLRIEELGLKVEARMTKVEKTLVMIRDWKTRGIKIKQEGST